jgi:hypothetical protein
MTRAQLENKIRTTANLGNVGVALLVAATKRKER